MVIGGGIALSTNGEGGIADKMHLGDSLVGMEDWMMDDETDRMALPLPFRYILP